MLELRWLIRHHPPNHNGATGWFERVLQYRSAYWYLGADGNIHPGRDQTGGPAMTEWADVPEVSDE